MSWLIWLWLGIFVLTLVVEIFTEELVSVWVSAGAFVALILAIFLPSDNSLWWVQVLSFAAVSITLIFALRPVIKKFYKINDRKTNSDAMIGEKAVVTKRITELEHGTVKYHGSTWPAVSLDGSEIEEEEVVVIENIQGNKLVVRVSK